MLKGYFCLLPMYLYAKDVRITMQMWFMIGIYKDEEKVLVSSNYISYILF